MFCLHCHSGWVQSPCSNDAKVNSTLIARIHILCEGKISNNLRGPDEFETPINWGYVNVVQLHYSLSQPVAHITRFGSHKWSQNKNKKNNHPFLQCSVIFIISIGFIKYVELSATTENISMFVRSLHLHIKWISFLLPSVKTIFTKSLKPIVFFINNKNCWVFLFLFYFFFVLLLCFELNGNPKNVVFIDWLIDWLQYKTLRWGKCNYFESRVWCSINAVMDWKKIALTLANML